jgi:lycopene cyclase domain-containing protein
MATEDRKNSRNHYDNTIHDCRHVFLYESIHGICIHWPCLIVYVLKFRFKITWLPQFLMTYLVLLLPFFIVNGLLTGTGLASPIVWYNNAENMEIRLLTIPLEDVFYGFGLLFLNVFFFEIFKKNEINDSPIYHHR